MVKKWSEMAAPVSSCQRCGARLADEEEPGFATLHVADEGDEVRREDLCQACFEAMDPRPTTYWRRTARPSAPADEQGDGRRTRTARLFDLFRALGDDGAPPQRTPEQTARQKLRYLAALALVRRRRLTLLESEHRDGIDALVVRRAGTRERVAVECPQLDPREFEPLLASLGRALEDGGAAEDDRTPEPEVAPVRPRATEERA